MKQVLLIYDNGFTQQYDIDEVDYWIERTAQKSYQELTEAYVIEAPYDFHSVLCNYKIKQDLEDLEEKREHERKQYEILKRKFEGGVNNTCNTPGGI